MSDRINIRYPEPLVDIDAVAAHLGVSVKSIYAWRLRGEGPPAYRVGKHLRYKLSEVDQWLSEQRDGARS